MSTFRLPTLKYENGENSDESPSQNLENGHSKSKEQEYFLKTRNDSEVSFAEQETTDSCEDEPMLEALDNLSDHELDELLGKALALNKRLKQHLKDESLSGGVKAQEKGTLDMSRTRNTVVLPPIVKNDSAMSTRLRTNR
ncbi:Hypothetical predicted protein [Paramuricea clavata]|uniref:Uncharacterized protein n=1 Tax=Paramuricea clavata TaxID=317549 RepID=A0A6S7JLL5_PARCT|nr:Hypothetical predicted protein [Paramuricea clavata]CAB4031908.1 Hypothetical predicted protein [Paramuricea clavata]